MLRRCSKPGSKVEGGCKRKKWRWKKGVKLTIGREKGKKNSHKKGGSVYTYEAAGHHRSLY